MKSNRKTTSQASTVDQASDASNMPPPRDRADPGLADDGSEDIASATSQKRHPIRRSVSINTVASRASRSDNEAKRGGRSRVPISRSSSLVRFSLLFMPAKRRCALPQNIERAPALQYFDLDRDLHPRADSGSKTTHSKTWPPKDAHHPSSSIHQVPNRGSSQHLGSQSGITSHVPAFDVYERLRGPINPVARSRPTSGSLATYTPSIQERRDSGATQTHPVRRAAPLRPSRTPVAFGADMR
jgi:hypothetical protein